MTGFIRRECRKRLVLVRDVHLSLVSLPVHDGLTNMRGSVR